MAKKTKLQKRTTPQTGDVVTTNNYRLGMKTKKNMPNGRMAVVTNKGDSKGVNPIVSITNKNKNAKNMTTISKDRNKFLKNSSAVLNNQVTKIKSTPKEIKKGDLPKKDINLSDKKVFGKTVGKLHWKDKKALKKNLK